MQIFFDKGPDGDGAVFDQPRTVIEAWDIAEVPAALSALDAAQGWLAGYCSYELGYALEPKLQPLMPENRRLPLLRFGVYDEPSVATVAGQGHIGPLAPRWDAATHAKAIKTLRDYIAAGDIYQANLTFPIDVDTSDGATALYAHIAEHQPVGHAALVLQNDLPDLLSRSPELFFRTKGRRIETAPMKGTMPRGKNAVEDAANRAFLDSDEKNRAENLMIVDLLRNDLSRVSKIGSVKVPKLFDVETYATVHQMVSRIEAELLPDVGLGGILRALYPCGSITGAPKVRAMEIIRELEPWPREAYCGSIGWWAPDGRSEFNVAIRTLMHDGTRAVMNVGGGIVWDSTAASEYEEALWKARFAQIPN
jgi:para-aminobenzoate synthetase component 1